MTTLTQEQINWLDKCSVSSPYYSKNARGVIIEVNDRLIDYTAPRWTLNPKTGLVDVAVTFDCSKQGLKDFKGVKFGVVAWNFDCTGNRLTSLEGAPQEVGDHFLCEDNQLTSLEGAPQRVGGQFSCKDNQLTSLVGAPHKVKDDFLCDNNSLISLVGAPRRVGGYFSCSYNQLTTLVGVPQKVGVDFWCDNNRLTSLEGAPLKVGNDLYCGNNRLTSLEGAPLKVGGEFWCDANPVSAKTLVTIFDKMQEGHSFVIAAASLKNKMSEKDWKLIAHHIPEAIRPGVSMLARFGAFG